MKLKEFRLTTKDNTSCYDKMVDYLSDRKFKILSSEQEIIDTDFIVELVLEWEEETVKSEYVAHHSVSELMDWFKNTYPNLFKLIPEFNIKQFEQLAHEIKSSSMLEYVLLEEEFGTNMFNPLDNEDFVPVKENVQLSIDEINKKGYYTSIQCYPYTPIGFFNFYGTDFQSLLNHVTEDQ